MSDVPEITQRHHELGQTLTMIGMDEQTIDLFAPILHLIKKDEQVHAVSLSFQVKAGVYTHIVDEGDFNLSLEVQENLEDPPFDDETPVSIETRLHPQFLSLLESCRNNLKAAGEFLLSLHTTDRENGLIHTKHWLATHISQTSPKGTSGCTTLWHRFDISADTMEKFARGDYNEELHAFLRNKIGFDLPLLPNQFTPDAMNTLTGELAQVVTEGLRGLFAVLPSAVSDEVETEYGDWEEEFHSPIESVVAFFKRRWLELSSCARWQCDLYRRNRTEWGSVWPDYLGSGA